MIYLNEVKITIIYFDCQYGSMNERERVARIVVTILLLLD